MPLREYVCRDCRIKVDVLEAGEPNGAACPDCHGNMDVVEFSLPAKVRVGKYGKAGGLPPEAPE